MPVWVRDYSWRQTDTAVFLSVPMRSVRVTQANIFCTDQYLKVGRLLLFSLARSLNKAMPCLPYAFPTRLFGGVLATADLPVGRSGQGGSAPSASHLLHPLGIPPPASFPLSSLCLSLPFAIVWQQ
uniref:Uncharacterized protein n=1 Tax=Chelonoidis abingdonii TaxID=106734 RepID=A0A8C0IUT8_CHEAB